MKVQEAKRTSAAKHYDIVIVPSGEGSSPRRYRAGVWKLVGLAVAVFVFCVAVTLAILMFTPVMMVLPLPNPVLEARYGRELLETQQRLQTLAQDVVILRDYNDQLRNALGQTELGRSVADAKSADRPPASAAQATAGNRDMAPPRAGAVSAPAGTRIVPTVMAGTPVLSRFVSSADLPLLLPVEGFVSQGFDPAHQHLGIDIAAKLGSPVHAPTDGYVIFAGWTYEDGNILILSHGSGYMTVFKHNQTILKQVATSVKRGEVIALLGSSGKTSQGPHLHFEVWKDGVPHDPSGLLLTPARLQ